MTVAPAVHCGYIPKRRAHAGAAPHLHDEPAKQVMRIFRTETL
jgi:hypothetical protein